MCRHFDISCGTRALACVSFTPALAYVPSRMQARVCKTVGPGALAGTALRITPIIAARAPSPRPPILSSVSIPKTSSAARWLTAWLTFAPANCGQPLTEPYTPAVQKLRATPRYSVAYPVCSFRRNFLLLNGLIRPCQNGMGRGVVNPTLGRVITSPVTLDAPRNPFIPFEIRPFFATGSNQSSRLALSSSADAESRAVI